MSQALSPLIDTETESPMCIELVREAASEVSHMRFQLIAANAHQRRVFFESPVETLSAQRKVGYDLSSHRIEADLQVGDATHPARVCVVLHGEACAF